MELSNHNTTVQDLHESNRKTINGVERSETGQIKQKYLIVIRSAYKIHTSP